MGAIAGGGIRILNDALIWRMRIPSELVETITAQEQRELEWRERVYRRGRPAPDTLKRLQAGVALEDGQARFDRITADPPGGGAHSSFRVVLHEGRNREVRRLWEAVGFEVSRLLRIRYGPIELPRDMRPGDARPADGGSLGRLRSAVRLP